MDRREKVGSWQSSGIKETDEAKELQVLQKLFTLLPPLHQKCFYVNYEVVNIVCCVPHKFLLIWPTLYEQQVLLFPIL
jgi:hypothetical protein